jgi:osmoprotectant transport system permease protein
LSTLQFLLNNVDRSIFLLIEHLCLVGSALMIAASIGIPLGILITRNEAAAKGVINVANVLMTIPSIALFGMMLPVLSIFNLGLGKVPAVIALVLYSQLPIIKNTYVAINSVPAAVVDAGKGMGMSKWQLMKEVQLPIAMPLIISGLRTAAVMNIGIAAIAAYIGAGGLGVFIQQGIDRIHQEMIIAGAVLVSALAVGVDAGMALLEKCLTPKGMKTQSR